MNALISLAAPAKINLYLHITGKRDDGYHLLDSLVAFCTVGDTVSARTGAELSLRVDGTFAGDLQEDDDNLVLKAARALQDITGMNKGAEIRLTKELPVASGIGGGSSDSAAAIKVLSRLWDVSLAEDTLMGLALSLGADVPACLRDNAVFMSGIGETLTDAPRLPGVWAVLVNPGVAVSTPEVFAERTGAFSPPGQFTRPAQSPAGLAGLLKERCNDLMAPAISLVPEIGDVLSAIEETPGCLLARMSGSGATCFGLYETEAAARAAAGDVSSAHTDWWAEAGRLF